MDRFRDELHKYWWDIGFYNGGIILKIENWRISIIRSLLPHDYKIVEVTDGKMWTTLKIISDTKMNSYNRLNSFYNYLLNESG